MDAEEAVDKINKLKSVSSADQLSSMGSGVKSLSDNLATKKETPKKAINYDILAGMSDELKECTAEWKNYEKVMGTASSTYEEYRRATDKLATAFVDSNNFLANLTESTKEYYISQLKSMGVSNAEAIVTATLAQRHREAAEAKQIESIKNEALTITKNGVTNETLKEVDALFQQENATRTVQYAIVDLIAQEQILANTSLGFDDKIAQLNNLASTYFGTAAAAEFMNKVQTSAEGALYGGGTISAEKAWEQTIQKYQKIAQKRIKFDIPTVAVSPKNYSTSKPESSKDKSKKSKESKQEIDWLSRKLTALQNIVDMLKAKFENLFSLGKKQNNLNNQIKNTTKLLKAQEKAASRYQKIADNYYKKHKKKLSKNGVNLNMLQNGSYDVKSYSQNVAQIIQTYEDYYDKAQEAKKATQELITTIKDLSKQKLDLKLEDNDRKRTYQDAKYANAKTAKDKNKILDQEIAAYTSDDTAYQNYYKRAKKLRNKEGKEAKSSVNKTKGLSKSDKNKIKNRIKQKKEIPANLMAKVLKASKSTYQKLVDYNNDVDFVADVLRDKKLANEQNKTSQREKKVEQQQNLADEAEAKYNLNQQYETNAVSAKEKNKYEAESLKYQNQQYNRLIEIAKLEGDVTEQKRLQAEKLENANESYKKMYDNIKAEYDNKTGLNDAKVSTVQAQITTLEAAGKSAGKALYLGMMQSAEEQKKLLSGELAELQSQAKNFTYGSEEWYVWQNDLESAKQKLYECTQNTIEWQKAINELDLKKFSIIAAQLDATKSHLDFLVDMLSHEDLTSKETGGFTDAGMATISLRFSNMDNHKKIVENAQKNLKELYAQHLDGRDGLTEEEFLAKREEELDIIRDSTSAILDEKYAILDLVENAMQLQIDSINELIEKKKKALATEKELYEYQKRVAKQTKNIALLEKQLAALSGDQSEEAMARKQKIQLSLEEAWEELQETEYDKWYDDQTDMLDDLSEEMEDFWERIMDDLKKDINGTMDKLMQMVTDNPEAIARAFDELGLGDALSIITESNGDGTHTDKAIDYGGNSYEGTYKDDTGENVNNKLETSIDDSIKDLDSSVQTFQKATEEEKERLREVITSLDDEIRRKAEEEDRIRKEKEQEKYEKEQAAKIKLENDKASAYQRADDIMSQVNSGTKNVIIGNAPKAGVQAIVEDFLKSSALHKPTTEAGKKRMETDPLLKYIAKNYKGKTLSNANEAILGAYLGIAVKDKNNVTTSEANKILKAFKNAGFANGGIAQMDSGVLRKVGEDGLVLARNGEGFIAPEHVKDMKAFTNTLPIANEMINNITKPQVLPEVEHRYVKASSINVGGVTIQLDGSGIKDEKSFCDMITNSTMVQSAIDQSVGKGITKAYANTFGRF